MLLNETPHIKLRKTRSGAYNIDYTSADIKELEYNPEPGAVVKSYNTIIGFYDYNTKIYFQDAASYSTTTAAKHKPRAARIAIYNNFQIIDVNHAALIELLQTNNRPEVIQEILQEDTARTAIYRKAGKLPSKNTVDETELYCRYARPTGRNTRKEYKNGNYKDYYIRRTNFQYLYNFHIKETRHYYRREVNKAGKTYIYYNTKKAAVYSIY